MPKRLACITPLYFDEFSYLGGGERYVGNLARAVTTASEADWFVDIVSYGPVPQTTQLDYGITLQILPTARAPRHPLDAMSWELPQAIRGADVIHVHQPFTRSGETAILASKLQRKPLCLTDLGGVASRLGPSLGALELADRIVALSEFSASLFLTPTPMTIIKGGVDDGFFRPAHPEQARNGFLYVGRLLPHKGIDRLIAALPEGLPLTICGATYDEGYLRILRRLASRKDVEFILAATDSDLRDLYRRSWAVVLPSVYVDFYGTSQVAPELMGLTLLEAAACATPAICSRVGGLPEFVRHGETGYVFDDLSELQKHLQCLAADRSLVRRLGSNGRQMVESEFGLAAVGRSAVALYEDLLSANGEPS